jgi:hypothetical protein
MLPSDVGKMLASEWSSDAILHLINDGFVSDVVRNWSTLEPAPKMRLLLSVAVKPQASRDNLLRLLTAADADLDEWVSTVSGLVRRWLFETNLEATPKLKGVMETTLQGIFDQVSQEWQTRVSSEGSDAALLETQTPYFFPEEGAYLCSSQQPPLSVFSNLHFKPLYDPAQRFGEDLDSDSSFQKAKEQAVEGARARPAPAVGGKASVAAGTPAFRRSAPITGAGGVGRLGAKDRTLPTTWKAGGGSGGGSSSGGSKKSKMKVLNIGDIAKIHKEQEAPAPPPNPPPSKKVKAEKDKAALASVAPPEDVKAEDERGDGASTERAPAEMSDTQVRDVDELQEAVEPPKSSSSAPLRMNPKSLLASVLDGAGTTSAQADDADARPPAPAAPTAPADTSQLDKVLEKRNALKDEDMRRIELFFQGVNPTPEVKQCKIKLHEETTDLPDTNETQRDTLLITLDYDSMVWQMSKKLKRKKRVLD